MTTLRTPSPWFVENEEGGNECWIATTPEVAGDGGIIVANPPEEEYMVSHSKWATNAAFIVRACNAHDDLVTVLKTIASIAWNSESPIREDIVKLAREAIAKAGGNN